MLHPGSDCCRSRIVRTADHPIKLDHCRVHYSLCTEPGGSNQSLQRGMGDTTGNGAEGTRRGGQEQQDRGAAGSNNAAKCRVPHLYRFAYA